MHVATEPELPAAAHKTTIASMEDVIAVAAEARLLESPFFELHHVSCECHGGVLTLRGRVSRYYLKQVAQSLVGRLSGVEEVDNQMRVLPFPK